MRTRLEVSDACCHAGWLDTEGSRYFPVEQTERERKREGERAINEFKSVAMTRFRVQRCGGLHNR